jgi:membrane-associated phospholipid phosphatase
MDKKYGSNIDWFWEVYLVFLVAGAVIIAVIPKGDVVLKLNSLSNASFDWFFKGFTTLGSGLIFIPFAFVLLFKRLYFIVAAAFSLLFTALTVSVFKQGLCHGYPRPTRFFDVDTFSHLIEGYNYYWANSFPSGHTATAFALAALIVLIYNHKILNLVAFLYAFGISVSRIYLLQHFFIDVYFGSVLGILAAFMGFICSHWLFARNNFLKKSLTFNFGFTHLLNWAKYIVIMNLKKWIFVVKKQFIQMQMRLF